MAVKYFFDLPVYRLPEARYYAERARFVDGVLFPPNTRAASLARERYARDPGAQLADVAFFERSYGGCWRFNEIIGQIRLYFLGTQVRGEYFAVKRKRIVRTRNKTLEFTTYKLAPEVDIETPVTDKSVLVAVEQYIESCRKELRGRVVDAELFFRVARHMRWTDLLADQ